MTITRRSVLTLLVLGAFVSTFLIGSRTGLAADDSWLKRLNQYRAMAGLAPFALESDNRMTSGADEFARCLVNKNSQAIQAGRLPRDSDLASDVNPWLDPWFFTYEQFAADHGSNAVVTSNVLAQAELIDRSMADPMTRLPLLVQEPPSVKVAYGASCVKGSCAATLYASDRFLALDVKQIGYGFQEKYKAPVLFPPDRSTLGVISLGHRSPDVSPNCEFKTPTGLPITLQFGRWLSPNIISGGMTANGKPVQACAIDAESYFNSNTYFENKLIQFGAIVIVPRLPLQPSTKYAVHVAVADYGAYDWSFSTGAKAIAIP